MEEIILHLEDAGKRYKGAIALDQGDLDLRRGELHVLTGGNASGKSTLAGILGGAVKPERGRIKFKGHNVYYEANIDALRDGIALVSQNVNLVLQMSIAENIWMGRETEFGKAGFISPKARSRATKELLDTYGIALDTEKRVETLNLAQMRMVELMRGLTYKPEVLILDEPTASFTGEEAGQIRALIRRLHEEGMTILLVSHDPEDIFKMADRVTIMRQGRTVGTYTSDELTEDELIAQVAGSEPVPAYPLEEKRQPGETVLECENIRSDFGARGASFAVREGEIVGLFGLFGAGRMQTLRAIFGLDKRSGGLLRIGGDELKPCGVTETVKHGAAMILPGKQRLGFFRGIATRWNTKMGYVAGGGKLFKGLSLDLERIDSSKNCSITGRISDLSDNGRNRVLMGRSMGKKPRLLISVDPISGIPVNTRNEIYKHLDKAAASGVGVLLSSYDVDEIVGMCDRVLVLRDGLVAADIPRAEASRESVLRAAFGLK